MRTASPYLMLSRGPTAKIWIPSEVNAGIATAEAPTKMEARMTATAVIFMLTVYAIFFLRTS